MNMERKFKVVFNFFVSVLILNFSLAQSKIAFIPFEDISGFKGKWNLKVEIPRYLGDFVLKFYGVEVFSVDSVVGVASEMGVGVRDAFLFSELKRRFGVEYVFGGKVLTFKVSRFMTGFPLMAGYESYNAEIEIEIEVFDPLTGERGIVFGISGEVKERGLGLTFLGKPTEKYSEFYSLDLLKFGSSEFNETIVGEAMKKSGMEFALRLKKYFPEIIEDARGEIADKVSGATELKAVVIEGMILLVGKQELVYVNLGRKDGIVSGMVLYVFDGDEKVGELEVVDVVDEHFSSCRIISSTKELKKGNKVKTRIIK
ncbi:hypothetical protein [Candidatus Kryptobacter tengchongensis]|nr:hypothetical protein [Candidatus Kryptobacter tengchongensis]